MSSKSKQSTSVCSDRKMNILVIDDDECDRQRYLRWLVGHSVDVVATIADAVQRTNEKRYDIVFCDVLMPEIHDLRPIDIIQFCKRIQGARLVAVSHADETDEKCDIPKTHRGLQDIVQSHCANEAQSIVIDLMNDLEDMHRKVRGC